MSDNWLTGFVPQAGGGGSLNFEHAENIQQGDDADQNGNTFEEVTENDDGTITFVVTNGDTFTKQPDDLVYSPKP